MVNALNETNPIVYKGNGAYLTALHLAAEMGRVRIIDYIAGNIDNINPHNNVGITPMEYAINGNKSIVLEYYLKSSELSNKNPGRNSSDSNRGRTPLHKASEKGLLDDVRMIMPYLGREHLFPSLAWWRVVMPLGGGI